MKTKTIWRRLLQYESAIVTRDVIEEICEDAGMDYDYLVHNLMTTGSVVRIFRGVFYVRSPDELLGGPHRMNLFEMIAEGLKAKGVGRWYFGLETALGLNNMTHEYLVVNYVVTDSFRTTKVIRIMDGDFRFLRWSGQRFKIGIIERDGIFLSDKERTVLDLIYRSCNRRTPEYYDGYNKVKGILKDYWDMLDRTKVEEYLGTYPLWMGELVWRNLQEISLRH